MPASPLTMTVYMRGLCFVRPVSTLAVYLAPFIGDAGAAWLVNTVLPWLVWMRVKGGRWHRMHGPFVEGLR